MKLEAKSPVILTEPFNEIRQLSVKVNSDEDDIAFIRLQDLIAEYGIETVVNKLIEA